MLIKHQNKEYADIALGIISKPFTLDGVVNVLMKSQEHRRETAESRI